VMIGTDCTDSCKSNYHTSTETTAPFMIRKRYLYNSIANRELQPWSETGNNKKKDM
jgi:hypothetical protein